MKTLIFSDNSLWGCLNFRGTIINYFINSGYRVVIVAPNDSFVSVSIPKNVIYENITMQRTGSSPIKDYMYMLRLKKIYRKYAPIAIFHYTIKPNIYGTFASKNLAIPSIMMVTGLGHVFNNKNITSRIAQKLYANAIKHAYKVLFLNEENYKCLKEKKIIKDSNSYIQKGGEGVDVNNFKCTPLKLNEKITFLMIARVLYDKGYIEYVEAAKANPNANFLLIGAIDTNPAAVPREIVEKEKAIEYLGFLPKEKVFDHIENATCLVLPSYHEGMSITLTESIAMGRPIICSDIAGCRETVEDGINGYLVPAQNGEALALACEKFSSLTHEERQLMAKRSRQIAEKRFDIKNIIKQYKNILFEIENK